MRITHLSFWGLLCVLTACSSSSSDSGDNGGAGAQGGGIAETGGVASTPSGGNANVSGGASSTGGTMQGNAEILLYGTPYVNVNMWYGPVDYAESEYHNACGLADGSKYPGVIQNLYGRYIIGLDGDNIPNVESHCDNCAQLTANGKTIIAHIVTYGTENGVAAIDLSPEARTALGLSDSNWTGTWQFSSCPTNGTPIYYQFDSRQWKPQNFWYMRLWTRNQRFPVTLLETKLGGAAWVAASQQSDGAWQTENGVDFSGGFQVRVTAVDNQQLVDTIAAPTGLNPANPVAGHTNFQ